jgi:hypothetical protein
MRSRDHQVQDFASRSARNINRRSFLGRAAAATAGGLAAVIVKPGTDTAFASNYACFPPCGIVCANCFPNSGCDGIFINCTSGNGPGGCCPYPEAWWYTAGAVGERHKCRDCQRQVGPNSCSACAGVCGCRSTQHF